MNGTGRFTYSPSTAIGCVQQAVRSLTAITGHTSSGEFTSEDKRQILAFAAEVQRLCQVIESEFA
jgi:hypothetical protein